MKPIPSGRGVYSLADLQGRCIRNDETGCLTWAGAVRDATGQLWVNGFGVRSLQWAFGYFLTGQAPASNDRWVPTCRNPLCTNQAHRVLGCPSMLVKVMRPKLSAEHRAKLTASARKRRTTKCSHEMAADIRGSNETVQQLVKRLGVGETTIYRVRRGEAWAAALQGASVFALGASR